MYMFMQRSLGMSAVGIGLALLAGCTEPTADTETPASVELSLETVDGDFRITLDGAVHEVVVEECDNDSCTQEVLHGEHLLGDSTVVTWETGVGEAPYLGSEWRAAPTITGTIQYGVLPTGAGYSSAHEPLKANTTYSINAYRYGECDDRDPQCFHITAVGGAFFRLGDSLAVELVQDPYPY